MTDAPFLPMTDGVVRAPTRRHPTTCPRWSPDVTTSRVVGSGLAWTIPHPTACIVVDGEIVGWVDFDPDENWLGPDEVNVGYQVFASHRGRGYASRAVQLLLHHLAVRTDRRTAVLSIDRENERSLALATRLGCEPARGHNEQSMDFRRPVPPLTYSDGVATLRPPRPDDLDADLAAKDEEQIRWMWLPGERETWAAMTPSEQREHARRGLRERVEAFGTGPKWTFSVDAGGEPYVAYVECDLANPNVPHGDANVSYSVHPAHRGRGHAARSVRLVAEFLRDHTGARELHILVDAENVASLRVARAVGATERERWTDGTARTMVRHVRSVRPR